MLDLELHSAHVYLVFVPIILTISVLSYPFLLTFYVVAVMVMGFQGWEIIILFRNASAELFYGVLLCYHCTKMVEFHHPGSLFRSNKLATTISVIDIIVHKVGIIIYFCTVSEFL